MFYVYLLKKPHSKYIYIGSSSCLQRRMKEHKKDKPDYKLIYCEVYLSEKDAKRREHKLKSYGSSLGHLKKRLANTLTNF